MLGGCRCIAAFRMAQDASPDLSAETLSLLRVTARPLVSLSIIAVPVFVLAIPIFDTAVVVIKNYTVKSILQEVK